jgi:hypothetical protein
MGAGPVLPAVFVIESADGEAGLGRNISTKAVLVPGDRLDQARCPERTQSWLGTDGGDRASSDQVTDAKRAQVGHSRCSNSLQAGQKV